MFLPEDALDGNVLTTVSGFCAIAGLIMIWIIALAFARRLLLRMAGPARNAVGLLFVVSLQMTTYMRPVLWRDTGAPLIELEKKSFFSHFWDVSASKP